ncbi:glucose-1-phosphate adenylyltransferase [Vibrio cincinnatiensis]|jgi:glucose-1-phosphate adenylyltransferase|uniref:Glucose-1-phosphate adenylyltransferase n=1 Tax=Vibrio cincinnatiensis DSM 19608 TaxID=1123491 RepID=A0A1T4S273_VIBCI|nr:glucose-1-phosphate adenylyltransferase [Vibrio cincinnatiensis]MCG3736679.1 glucose-1-phosphate adenylyltransferase [Vibrio cincinnatiensis]MCG3747151.1 glucose-1-phosphate adenylyltransferase [Vibrio cincinnatiensis]MCG3760053.1 glucose-1-phosphate adenylyltransferase [Vibrio cincinnatiensis]MCG3763360.1 glucose-1-phosphate adenylyltransferase [Vibrio cincinnatiensis]MCG3767653.1 glucose-1-phosphate adenylyltransferase [Vibrio cincinnatiensis]
MQETLAIVLAGGIGSRLSPLTDGRAKPAVPFGGKYRIIDFTLTNCLHSGLRRILVLTQYKSHSLHKHLRDGWSIFNPELGEYITAIPPQMRKGGKWYEGTADALYHNMWLLSRSDAKYVVVLSGDHIYRMDYAAMLEEHIENNAILTIACMEVSQQEAQAFGVLSTDAHHCIHHFVEKPEEPATLPHSPNRSLASMGVYIFNMETLQQALIEDADLDSSSHDFGKDIIPKLIPTGQVFAYPFGSEKGRVAKDCYWRDVGTLDSFYEANMDLLDPIPPMNLYQQDWAIRTYEPQLPPARTVSSATGNEGIFINSIIANGVINSGGSVQRSIISSGVHIDDGATVMDSILLDGVEVGSGCQLARCIVDKHVKIPPNTHIGIHHNEDKQRFTVSEKGIVVVPENYQFQRR